MRVELSEKDVCDLRQCIEARVFHCKRQANEERPRPPERATLGYWGHEVERWTQVLADFDAKTKAPVSTYMPDAGYADEFGGWKPYDDPDML